MLRRQQGALCGRSEIIKERVIADAVKEEAGGHSKAFDVRPERDRSHGKYLSRGAAHSDLGFNEIAMEHDWGEQEDQWGGFHNETGEREGGYSGVAREARLWIFLFESRADRQDSLIRLNEGCETKFRLKQSEEWHYHLLKWVTLCKGSRETGMRSPCEVDCSYLILWELIPFSPQLSLSKVKYYCYSYSIHKELRHYSTMFLKPHGCGVGIVILMSLPLHVHQGSQTAK